VSKGLLNVVPSPVAIDGWTEYRYMNGDDMEYMMKEVCNILH